LKQTGEIKKHWVRLTKLCNNRCVFCLDSDEQDGAAVPAAVVLANLEKGIAAGCAQAVLSGGEPTLHPDFIEIISASKKMGYSWVQAITNGRMFNYAGFLDRAAAAGLDEITFSMHDTDPERMDALTRAPGGFDEAMKGLLRALAKNGLAVTVDVLWSALNAGRLKSIVASLAALGVSDFDILYPIPFGEAWPNRERIFPDIGQHKNDLLETIAFCESKGIRVWMNRVPPAALEGAERYIQKPQKLRVEVAAREEMFEALAGGVAPPCMGARCDYCHVRSFCDALSGLAASVAAAQPAPIRVTHENVSRLAIPFPFTPQTLVLETPALLGSAPVRKFLAETNAAVEVMCSELAAAAGLDAKAVSRIYVEVNNNSARELLVLGPSCLPRERATLVLRSRATLEETLEKDVRISDFANGFRDKWNSFPSMANVPPCITGAGRFVALPGIPADVFRADGGIDLDKFTGHHIELGMYAKSARCAGCKMFGPCPGLPINHVRAFGFSTIPGPVV
jgi:molybdenum cofactor biosynthesis enzyme MoaA